MAKKNTPAWQQVVQIALNNVPERDNGRDAWEKLNEEERSAVMDFLREHCGEEAPAKLEEICGKIKHPKWWTWCWGILGFLLFMAVWLWLYDWLQDLLDTRVTPYVWLILCPLNMHTAWQGNPAGNAMEIWKKHAATHDGTTLALDYMLRAYTAPRRERMSKGMFVSWLVLWLLHIGLLLWDYLE